MQNIQTLETFFFLWPALEHWTGKDLKFQFAQLMPMAALRVLGTQKAVALSQIRQSHAIAHAVGLLVGGNIWVFPVLNALESCIRSDRSTQLHYTSDVILCQVGPTRSGHDFIPFTLTARIISFNSGARLPHWKATKPEYQILSQQKEDSI